MFELIFELIQKHIEHMTDCTEDGYNPLRENFYRAPLGSADVLKGMLQCHLRIEGYSPKVLTVTNSRSNLAVFGVELDPYSIHFEALRIL